MYEAVGISIIITIGIALIAYYFLNNTQQKKQNRGVLLSIKVSRTNEKGPLAAEQMLASLHGILKKSFFLREADKNQEYFSFEIASLKQNIYFFVWVPEELKSFIEGQIYAQYPDIEIEITNKDYAYEFNDIKSAGAAILQLQKHDLFPLKQFEEFEEKIQSQTLDPLSGITEAIGKLDNINEQVWLQIIAKPIKNKWWNLKAEKAVQLLEKGKKAFYFNDTKCHIIVNPFAKIILAPFDLLKNLFSSLFQHTPKEGETNESKSINEVEKIINKAILKKSTKLGYRVEIKIIYLSKNKNENTETKIRTVAGSFKQFNTIHLNGFSYKKIHYQKILNAYRKRSFISTGMILNIEELASIFHLPNLLVQTPNIVWVSSKKMEPPTNIPTKGNTDPNNLTLIGETNYRGLRKKFGIKLDDRRRHTYIIGKTGMGKTVLLENMIYSDMMAGRGVGVIDPHGELADTILSLVPSCRMNDVIIFDPSDTEFPVALNMLENVDPNYRSVATSGLISVIKKMFDSWGPRLEYVLRNTILALMEYQGTSMLGIMKILVDENFREKVLARVQDPVVKSFWKDEFAKYSPRELPNIISPIQNKVGQFLSSPVVRNIVGQTKSTIKLREAMDQQKILIVNLSKGKIGEDNSSLLGSMIITKFQIDAMSRADVQEGERKDFSLFVDEFQNFATDSFATILSEARKYRLNLTMANQFISQIDEDVRGAVFGNVGSIISFQTGYDDAEYLANQFSQNVTENDIINLSKYTIYSRLLIDGMPSQVFSAKTLPPTKDSISNLDPNRRQKVIHLSRERYSKNKLTVEDKIKRWSENSSMPQINADDTPLEALSKTKNKKKTVQDLKIPKIPQIDPTDIKIGEYIECIVTGVTNYGIFFNYKGINGLIHKSEIPNPDILKKKNIPYELGDKIKCTVTNYNNEKLACSLNPKHLNNKSN